MADDRFALPCEGRFDPDRGELVITGTNAAGEPLRVAFPFEAFLTLHAEAQRGLLMRMTRQEAVRFGALDPVPVPAHSVTIGVTDPGTVDLYIDKGRDTQVVITLPADAALKLGSALVVAAGLKG